MMELNMSIFKCTISIIHIPECYIIIPSKCMDVFDDDIKKLLKFPHFTTGCITCQTTWHTFKSNPSRFLPEWI